LGVRWFLRSRLRWFSWRIKETNWCWQHHWSPQGLHWPLNNSFSARKRCPKAHWRSIRLLVRVRSYALWTSSLSFLDERRRIPKEIPRWFHRWRHRLDSRMVLHSECDFNCSEKRESLQESHCQRNCACSWWQENVQI